MNLKDLQAKIKDMILRIEISTKMGHDHILSKGQAGFGIKLIYMPPFYQPLVSYLSYKNKNLFKNLNSLKLH